MEDLTLSLDFKPKTLAVGKAPATFYEHADEILNFFDNRSTNASAESINSKIKAFRAKLNSA